MRVTFDSVVQILLEKLELRRRERTRRKPGGSGDASFLFLLGAGCSMQYGLPGYRDLLRLVLTEKFKRPSVRRETSLQDLQREIEISWRQNRERHRDWLNQYLAGVDGRDCLGYRRLARLLRERVFDGVVNLNFDRLLAEACRAEGLPLPPATNVEPSSQRPMLIEPHGGIGDLSASPILDLRTGGARVFDPSGVLGRSHVVVIGYGSGDDAILDALAARELPEEALGSLFYFSLEEPQELKARELLAWTLNRRNRGDDLAPFDPACTFENLMEALDEGRSRPVRRGARPAEPWLDPGLERFTHSEALALTRCRRLADRLRLASSVADSSPIEIAEHAREIADLACRLAEAAGIRLLPHERVLVSTVALFHDLGYYWSASHELFGRYQGWRIHRLHGAMVARMLRDWKREHEGLFEEIIPAAYRLAEADQRQYFALILWLCSQHNKLLTTEETHDATIDLTIAGITVPVRRRILQVLISAAEHLSLEHPFQPSLDPVHDGASQGTIDDPVLHLILVRRRGIRFDGFDVKVNGNKIHAKLDPAWAQKSIARFFVSRIARLINALSDLAKRSPGGRRVHFESNVRPGPLGAPDVSDVRAVTLCLEESLGEAVDAVAADRVDTHVALLDLLAIYCLGGRGEGWGEPRLDCAGSPAVLKAMERVRAADPAGRRKSLVQEFVEGRIRGRHDEIDSEFARCFEERIFPAWRFVGKKWRDGIEATTTALTTLEMGSSRYRSEVVVGLRKLLRDKIEWRGHLAMAHDGCVLCCSRLMMAFSYARLLFDDRELDERFVDFRGFTLLDALRGLLRYFLGLDPADSRWCGEQPQAGKVAVRSADYVAYAASAVAFFLSTDDLVVMRGGASLDLSVRPRRVPGEAPRPVLLPEKGVDDLLGERWSALFGYTTDDLLSPAAEEPHSLVLGRIAIVMLSRDYFTPRVASLVVADGPRVEAFTEHLAEAWKRLELQGLSHLGRLNLWPALLLLDRLRPSEDLARRNLARYHECRESPIWVERGGDFGSWGFNVRTTAIVCSALNAFWRHVLFNDENRERYRALWAATSEAQNPVASPLEAEALTLGAYHP